MNKIRISDKYIGDSNPCFIIAEAGVNHNGILSNAIKLIEIAAEAGADAVKFQAFNTQYLTIPDAPKAQYQIEATETKESQTEMLKKPRKSENNIKHIARRSIYSSRFLPKNTILKQKDLISLRPSGGISPSQIESLINKKTIREIPPYKLLKLIDIE